MIAFTIPGVSGATAQQKGAFVVGKRVMFYTKDTVKSEYNRLYAACYAQRPAKPIEGPIHLEVAYVFPMTKAEIKQHWSFIDVANFVIWKLTRPDVDNCAKLMLDVLTDANFYHDDSQVSDLILRKRSGCEPRITVTIRPSRDDEQALDASSAGMLPTVLGQR